MNTELSKDKLKIEYQLLNNFKAADNKTIFHLYTAYLPGVIREFAQISIKYKPDLI